MADIPRISITELKRRLDAGESFTIVDVRNPEAWQQSDAILPGAIRVPIDEWEDNLGRISKAKPIVTYCT